MTNEELRADRIVITESRDETELTTDESLVGRRGVALSCDTNIEGKEFWVVQLDGETTPRCISRSRLVTEQTYLGNKDSSATEKLLNTVSSLVLIGRSRAGLNISIAAAKFIDDCEQILEKELCVTMREIVKIKPDFKDANWRSEEQRLLMERGAGWHNERLYMVLHKIINKKKE